MHSHTSLQPQATEPALAVDLAHDAVAVIQAEVGGGVSLRQGDVAVQVALPRGLDDGAADGRAPGALPQRLVAGYQLLQLLPGDMTITMVVVMLARECMTRRTSW